MASTLEVVLDRSQVFQLWSWTASPSGDSHHYSIRLQQRLRTNVYTALMGPLAGPPTQTVIVKMAHAEQVSALDWEAEMYEKDLRGLQGSVVPICYGYFKGRSGGQSVSCLVLEFCNQAFRNADFSQQIVLATANLHQSGICHGNILGGSHFVLSSSGIRIIDFAQARRHQCRSSQCEELAIVEERYGRVEEAQIYPHRMRKGSMYSVRSHYYKIYTYYEA